jgi:hypothetical protein
MKKYLCSLSGLAIVSTPVLTTGRRQAEGTLLKGWNILESALKKQSKERGVQTASIWKPRRETFS